MNHDFHPYPETPRQFVQWAVLDWCIVAMIDGTLTVWDVAVGCGGVDNRFTLTFFCETISL